MTHCQYINIKGLRCPHNLSHRSSQACIDHTCIVDDCRNVVLQDGCLKCAEHSHIRLGRCEYVNYYGMSCNLQIIGDAQFCCNHTFEPCCYRDPNTFQLCGLNAMDRETPYCERHGCHYFVNDEGYCANPATNLAVHACDQHLGICSYLNAQQHKCGQLFLKTEHKIDEQHQSVRFFTCEEHRCTDFDEGEYGSHKCNAIPQPNDPHCCQKHAIWRQFKKFEYINTALNTDDIIQNIIHINY